MGAVYLEEMVRTAVDAAYKPLFDSLKRESDATTRLAREFSEITGEEAQSHGSVRTRPWDVHPYIDPESITLHERVQELAKEKRIPYTEAFKLVRQQPRASTQAEISPAPTFTDAVDPSSVTFHEAVTRRSARDGITYVEAYKAERFSESATPGNLGMLNNGSTPSAAGSARVLVPLGARSDWLTILDADANPNSADGYSRDDLDGIVSDFEGRAQEDAPSLGLGYPGEHPEPYGTVSALRRNGDHLQAKVTGVHPDVAHLFQRGVLSKGVASIKRSPERISLIRVGLVKPNRNSGGTPALSELMKAETSLRHEVTDLG